MVTQRPYVEQTDSQRAPREALPTMYDLPSEDLKEPGLPDEYHGWQPQLLSNTLRISDYQADQIFRGFDINLYYDLDHPLWYKRPDWFAVLGVPRLYGGSELRNSYVIWQEQVSPDIVVELLSPGTEREDLGPYAESATTGEPLPALKDEAQGAEGPPPKWTVYEQILKIPNYVVFSRYTNRLRFFRLIGGRYREQAFDIARPRVWIPELNIGLGLWQGEYEYKERLWLRWYDNNEQWIPTDAESLNEERRQREQLLAKLRERGIDPDKLLNS